jgi:hypothetical protein
MAKLLFSVMNLPTCGEGEECSRSSTSSALMTGSSVCVARSSCWGTLFAYWKFEFTYSLWTVIEGRVIYTYLFVWDREAPLFRVASDEGWL